MAIRARSPILQCHVGYSVETNGETMSYAQGALTSYTCLLPDTAHV
jgi:hypothetical protein